MPVLNAAPPESPAPDWPPSLMGSLFISGQKSRRWSAKKFQKVEFEREFGGVNYVIYGRGRKEVAVPQFFSLSDIPSVNLWRGSSKKRNRIGMLQ